MRILTITHNYPRWDGDRAGAFVARLAAEIVELGHPVRVVEAVDVRFLLEDMFAKTRKFGREAA